MAEQKQTKRQKAIDAISNKIVRFVVLETFKDEWAAQAKLANAIQCLAEAKELLSDEGAEGG